MVTKTMTWKCYQLCSFCVKKQLANRLLVYTRFVCVLKCKPVCARSCIVKSPCLD